LRLLGYFIQIDRGVTPDFFFQFDISTLAKIWRDTPQNFCHGNFAFLRLSGDFGCTVIWELESPGKLSGIKSGRSSAFLSEFELYHPSF
jgi:hypothetical protein